MRMLSILTAAALGLGASYGLANAQATNMAPVPGTAKTLSGTGQDVDRGSMMRSNRGAMKSKSGKSSKNKKMMRSTTGQSDRSVPRRYQRGTTPVKEHPGDPRFWR